MQARTSTKVNSMSKAITQEALNRLWPSVINDYQVDLQNGLLMLRLTVIDGSSKDVIVTGISKFLWLDSNAYLDGSRWPQLEINGFYCLELDSSQDMHNERMQIEGFNLIIEVCEDIVIQLKAVGFSINFESYDL
jgi:hypothetical protein